MKRNFTYLMLAGTIAAFAPGIGHASNKITPAFKKCLNQAVQKQELDVERVDVEGDSAAKGEKSSVIGITCQDAAAEELFEQVEPFAEEHDSRGSDGVRMILRDFGTTHVPSQCVKLVGTPDKPGSVWCAIHLDLADGMARALEIL